jgi:putative membrane protein
MDYITQHWSYDPFVILAIVVAVWHEIGLWRLARRSRPEQTRERRLRSLWFYAGLVVLMLAVTSPLDYWGYDYFIAHMIQHLLLMFAAPTLIVAGAPWQPLLGALYPALPGRPGSGMTGGRPTGGWSRPLRALGGFVLRPWVSVALFNAAMLVWQLPGPLDLAETSRAVHIWLMLGSFFATGVLFWLQFIPSPPFRRRMPTVSLVAALVVTNVVMIGIAMALSIFVSNSVYSVYDHLPGVTLSPYADQQIGAAILWVCGDFWALPTTIVVVRRMIASDGSFTAVLDKVLNRAASESAPAGWGWAGGGPRGAAAVPRAVSAAPAQPSPPDVES